MPLLGSVLRMKQMLSTPAPSSGEQSLYAKPDGLIYTRTLSSGEQRLAMAMEVGAGSEPTYYGLNVVSPFTASPTLGVQVTGRIVVLEGGVARPSGSSTGWTTVATLPIPTLLAPASDVAFPAATWINSSATHQFQITTAGQLQVRMSGAWGSSMQVGGLTWVSG